MCPFSDSLASVVLSSLQLRNEELDESTAPNAIASEHQREVLAFFSWCSSATIEEASAALVLPLWNIERALANIHGEAVPYRKKKAPPPPELARGAIPSWPSKRKKGKVRV